MQSESGLRLSKRRHLHYELPVHYTRVPRWPLITHLRQCMDKGGCNEVTLQPTNQKIAMKNFERKIFFDRGWAPDPDRGGEGGPDPDLGGGGLI